MPDIPKNKYELPFNVRKILQPAAIGGAALFLAAMDGHPLNSTDPSHSYSLAAAEASVNYSPLLEEPSVQAKTNQKNTSQCTSIRTRPNYIYTGWACAEKGDSYTPIGYLDKGWVYSAVKLAVKGKDIYKCGYVREDVLPVEATRSRAVTHCKNYYTDFVRKRNVFFRKYNCGDKGPDPCKDGTYFSPVSSACANPKTYRNFESDLPSPLNIYGTGQGGFRGRIKENKTTSVNYRVEFARTTSKGIVAMIARAPEWGIGDSRCVSQKHRKGGTLK